MLRLNRVASFPGHLTRVRLPNWTGTKLRVTPIVLIGKKMKRCLVADHDSAVRSALRLVLETRFEQIIVSEAADLAELRDRAATTPSECIILDWELPGLAAPDTLELLRLITPGVRIIVISVRPEAATEALAAHADAFVAKSDSPDVMLDALQRGDTYETQTSD